MSLTKFYHYYYYSAVQLGVETDLVGDHLQDGDEIIGALRTAGIAVSLYSLTPRQNWSAIKRNIIQHTRPRSQLAGRIEENSSAMQSLTARPT